jgi:hypothetical protein
MKKKSHKLGILIIKTKLKIIGSKKEYHRRRHSSSG